MVHAADPNGLVVLTQVQPIAVIFTLPEDQLNAVRDRLRQGRKLPVDAFDRDLKHKLATGELATVDNQIDTTTGTVKLKAVFPNVDDGLFPNQFVNPRLLIDTLSGRRPRAERRDPAQHAVHVRLRRERGSDRRGAPRRGAAH